EAAHQLLEDGAHGVIVEAGQPDGGVAVEDRKRTQVDGRIEELLDERAQGVGFGQTWDLVAEFKVVDDLLDIGRKAVQVVSNVRLELLATAARAKVAQCEL